MNGSEVLFPYILISEVPRMMLNVTEVGKNKVVKTQEAKMYLTQNLIDA